MDGQTDGTDEEGPRVLTVRNPDVPTEDGANAIPEVEDDADTTAVEEDVQGDKEKEELGVDEEEDGEDDANESGGDHTGISSLLFLPSGTHSLLTSIQNPSLICGLNKSVFMLSLSLQPSFR